MNENSQPRISRRTVTAGLAWSVPTALTVAGAPLAAASAPIECDRATVWEAWLNSGAGLLPGESLTIVMGDKPVYDETGNQIGTEPYPAWQFTGSGSVGISYRQGGGIGLYVDTESGETTAQAFTTYGDQEVAEVDAISFGGRDRRYEFNAGTCTVEKAGPCDVDKLWRENGYGFQVDPATGTVGAVVTLQRINQIIANYGAEFTEIVSITGTLYANYSDGTSVDSGPVPLTLDDRGEAVLSLVGPAGAPLSSVSRTFEIVIAPSDTNPEQSTYFFDQFGVFVDAQSCTIRPFTGGS